MLRIRFLLPVLVFVPGLSCLMAEARPKAEPMDILFIIVDDLNDWVGPLGGHPQVETPHLDELATDSFVFTNAHTPSPACQPARYALYSGLHPVSSGWYGNYFETGVHEMAERLQSVTHLPARLQAAGYHTAGGGKVYHAAVNDYWPFDQWDEVMPVWEVPEAWWQRIPTRYDKLYHPFPEDGGAIWAELGIRAGYSLTGGPIERDTLPDGLMFDEMITAWALDQMDLPRSQPQFLAVGYVRPHVPYTVPPEYFDAYPLDDLYIPDSPGGVLDDVPILGKAMTYGLATGGDEAVVRRLGERYRRELIQSYLACITFVDTEIGKLLDGLKAAGRWEDTIIIVTSDHGQNFGEKRNWRKMCLWEESTRVPLLIRVPGQGGAGRQIGEAVSLLDLYPTLMDLAGIEAPDHLDGVSLVPLMRDPTAERGRPVLISWQAGNHALRSRDWRYIRYRDGSEELYDHRSDPEEQTNLVGLAEVEAILESMRASLPKETAPPVSPTARDHDFVDRVLLRWAEDGVPDWVEE